jgi:tRNA modification GTPase
MKPQAPGDTIAGISTPLGTGGIGVIRISGPRALAIAARLFTRKSGRGPLLSHRVYLGEMKDPASGAVLDEVFLIPMHLPKTYTREDVVEIQCHSGSLILRKILEAVLQSGARLAAPGEFTKRAFLNGRIDLTQAEAVIDLISSRTRRSLELANRQRSGALGREALSIKDELVSLLALLEMAIDFPEEETPELSRSEIAERFRSALGRLESLLRTYREGRLYREGISAVIIGRPNVGKSSLLNCLLQEDRAIVTAIPGTTRDLIEEVVNLNGIPLTLIDTAGLRPARDPIEEEGIRRTRDCLARADLAIWVVDGSENLKPEDLEILPQVRSMKTVVALNKADLPPGRSGGELPDRIPGRSIVPVSALRNTGMEALKEEIHALILNGTEESSAEILISNLRHKEALEEAHAALSQALASWDGNLSPEFPALDLQRALSALGALVGETTSEDILDQIFSRFCIGK